MKKTILLVFITLLLFSCSKYVSVNIKELEKPLPHDTEVTIGKLKNGLQYYIRNNNKPEGEIEFRLIVKAGSLQETDEEQGIAHFVEHMAFNGSKNFKKNEIIEFLQSSGQQFGPDLNGYTSYDHTLYRFRVTRDQPGIIDNSLLILKDWASGIRFREDDVNAERGIIVEEWRLRKNVWGRLRKKFRPVLFNDSIHVRRDPIGKIEIIQNVQANQLKRYYQNWYRPELIGIIVVGNVADMNIEEKIKAVFSDLVNASSAPLIKPYIIQPHKEPKHGAISDPEFTQSELWIYQKHPAIPFQTEQDFRNHLMEDLYVSILDTRLSTIDSVDSFIVKGGYKKCSLTSSDLCHLARIRIKGNYFEKGMHQILQETEKLKRFGIFESEVERAKKVILRQVKSAVLERDNTLSDLHVDLIKSHFFNNDIILSADERYRLVKKYLPTITPKNINTLRGKFNVEKDRVTVVFGNDKDSSSLPDKLMVKKLYQVVKFEQLKPYLDEVSDLPFFTEQVEKGQIIEEMYEQKIGVTTWKLSNGGQVVIKPTDFKKDEILLNLYIPGGYSILEEDNFRSVLLLGKVIFNSGIGPFSRNDLIKRLIFKKVKGDVYIEDRRHGFWGETSPEDLEIMTQLIRVAIAQPRFEKAIFEEQKQNLVEKFSNSAKTANWKYANSVLTYLIPNNGFAGYPSGDDISRINYQTFQTVGEKLFLNRGEFTLVVVGNVDLKELRELVEKYIASYQVNGKPVPLKDMNLYPLKGPHRIVVKENLENKSQIYIRISNEDQYDYQREQEYLALVQIMNIRINREIREKLGLIYSAKTSFQFFDFPKPASAFHINIFGCAPDNVDQVIAELKKIIDDLKENPVSAQQAQNIKKILQKLYEKQIKNNWYWLNSLKKMLTSQQDIVKIPDWEKYLDEISPETLHEAAKKYLNEENFFVGILMPKEK